MITINDFDAVFGGIGDRLLPDEDSIGGGYCNNPGSRRPGSSSSPLVKTSAAWLSSGLFYFPSKG
ncbi:hypothetical protein [Ectopseudomonas oleovorans]|uniref:hypothetical protein n=1 Tax=Ectopseudomonas oleovorans TaxID=301 RepID=UPI0010BE4842|nr:hypothetical protein [Pseudomonas oleovorans]